jgi:hypothetical protein
LPAAAYALQNTPERGLKQAHKARITAVFVFVVSLYYSNMSEETLPQWRQEEEVFTQSHALQLIIGS